MLDVTERDFGAAGLVEGIQRSKHFGGVRSRNRQAG